MPPQATAAAKAFKLPAQSISIWQAARGQEAALRGAGVSDFVFGGGDALAALQEAWQRVERA